MLPIHTSEAGFPMAPTQEEWDALTELERAQVIDALPGEVTYEEMAPPEGDRHQKPKMKALDALQSFYDRTKRRVYLASEMPVYYPKAPRFAPDLLAVFDVDNHERDKWVVSAEKRGLDWVLEVHVGGDRKKDAERNVTRYAQDGIPEYFLFDRSRNSLFAYRLAAGATTYTPIVPQGGRYLSAVLGLEVQIEQDRLRFYAGSALLLESAELITRLEKMVYEVQERAEEEARLRQEEARLRQEEARLREVAEAELEKVRAELDALKKKL